MSGLGDEQLIAWGAAALNAEAGALHAAGDKLGPAFAGACRAILSARGKVVLTGLGKSGHIGRKIASTLSSTGSSAFFLHPTEALHGDFGMLQPADCLIAIAYGGETHEVVEVARYARRIGLVVIAVTGKLESSLGRLAHHTLDGGVSREADPLNLAPTSSSTLAMALGDALAVTLMHARGFSERDFASLHPGGTLGRRLSLVRDHMHAGVHLPRVGEGANFHEVLQAVTTDNLGIAAVVSAAGHLVGAISDGDLRRALLKRGAEALTMNAGGLMTRSPKVIDAAALAIDAVRVMNESRVSRLFVVDGSPAAPSAIGLVRLQDLLAAKIL